MGLARSPFSDYYSMGSISNSSIMNRLNRINRNRLTRINRGNTKPYPEDFSSMCVFPPLPARNRDDPNNPGDTRFFTPGEDVCLRQLPTRHSFFDSLEIPFKKGIYVRSRLNPNGKIFSHIINSDNLERVVDFMEVGKLVLKPEVFKSVFEKMTSGRVRSAGELGLVAATPELDPSVYTGYGGKSRKEKKFRKSRKTRKSRKLRR